MRNTYYMVIVAILLTCSCAGTDIPPADNQHLPPPVPETFVLYCAGAGYVHLAGNVVFVMITGDDPSQFVIDTRTAFGHTPDGIQERDGYSLLAYHFERME